MYNNAVLLEFVSITRSCQIAPHSYIILPSTITQI